LPAAGSARRPRRRKRQSNAKGNCYSLVKVSAISASVTPIRHELKGCFYAAFCQDYWLARSMDVILPACRTDFSDI
jgi:hypothetical protein